MKDYIHVKTLTGTKVHVAIKGIRPALCGVNYVMATNAPVTCVSCGADGGRYAAREVK